MKVAVTAEAEGLDSPIDPRFGRAKAFVIADTDTGEVETAPNEQNLSAARGAGIQAGQALVRRGVQAVISTHVGPKAFATLQAGGLKVYTVPGGTVREALERFRAGQLDPVRAADVEGHWA